MQSEFAGKHGLKLSTLQYWLYRTHRPEPPQNPGFKEVSLPVPLLAPAGVTDIAAGPEITLRLGASSTPEFIAQVIHHQTPCAKRGVPGGYPSKPSSGIIH
jgi:hypothetical protein